MSKYCKKCGNEIPDSYKKNLCDYHQNKKYGLIRKIGEGVLAVGSLVGTVVLIIFTKGRFGGPKA